MVELRRIFPTDFDDIKTADGHDSGPQVVLISSKSARKIGGKSPFEIRNRINKKKNFTFDRKTGQCFCFPRMMFFQMSNKFDQW